MFLILELMLKVISTWSPNGGFRDFRLFIFAGFEGGGCGCVFGVGESAIAE